MLAGPATACPDLARATAHVLDQAHWPYRLHSCPGAERPLTVLTSASGIEPKSWVNWSAAHLVAELPPGETLLVDGVTNSDWRNWQPFLREFEAAIRGLPSGARPQLVLVVRGVPHAALKTDNAVLNVMRWWGVVGELDVLIHVSRLLRDPDGARRRRQKLVVRQIVALAQWDLELAEFLANQEHRDLFDPLHVLARAREEMDPECIPAGPDWHQGGAERMDGHDLAHPHVLIERGDPQGEIQRRTWAAQAAELLPLIELRRRELLPSLERYLTRPVLQGTERIENLDDIEIGSLAHLARRAKVNKDLLARVQQLAGYRNALAHLESLDGADALDPYLLGSLPGRS